ncbi:MAG TPA: lytic transglycosylase domain-containing protein [Accumulibacter sp.]|uniref:lytic transglycosylase domain-containing protein n=1 Tax=Accumulibacter sp. TaxID=2053492 RepID=UPI0025FA46AB|nr:lytic transglycosylase domain-containing protein [Accumulibacter sp.]MCM8599412.1 lytic transglycosylase domain-containing protein [Accumulibacter sp.]MCM8663596.1 lytic transglycosylase domain-containing protein [Accumulibacter sp.]HNC52505.1 lytic transglycosylase domain-containing protein [Accumulibacter sp.]
MNGFRHQTNEQQNGCHVLTTRRRPDDGDAVRAAGGQPDGHAARLGRRLAAGVALALPLVGLLPCSAGAATVGNVFVSYSADGVPSYASQRLDASYRLLIRGETPAATRKLAARPASDGQAPNRAELAPLIEYYARLHNVTPALVAAVVGVESGFNARAISPKGAMGAMQLMPATAARYGVTNPDDPAQNIDAGVRHLKDLLREHQGNVALALAAYNAGQGAVARHGGRIPPYRETMLYVPAVLAAAARGNRQ